MNTRVDQLPTRISSAVPFNHNLSGHAACTTLPQVRLSVIAPPAKDKGSPETSPPVRSIGAVQRIAGIGIWTADAATPSARRVRSAFGALTNVTLAAMANHASFIL